MSIDPYAELTDVEVLARASAAFKKAIALPVGSIQRAIQWAAFDSCMAELDRRLAQHVLAKIRRETG